MNGWKNYQTWAVNLWLTNEESTEKHFRQLAAEKDTAELAEDIQNFIEENSPLNILSLEASMYHDLLSNAINQVDCYELAEGFKG